MHVLVRHAIPALPIHSSASAQLPVSGPAATLPSTLHTASHPLQGIPVPTLTVWGPHAVVLSGEQWTVGDVAGQRGGGWGGAPCFPAPSARHGRQEASRAGARADLRGEEVPRVVVVGAGRTGVALVDVVRAVGQARREGWADDGVRRRGTGIVRDLLGVRQRWARAGHGGSSEVVAAPGVDRVVDTEVCECRLSASASEIGHCEGQGWRGSTRGCQRGSPCGGGSLHGLPDPMTRVRHCQIGGPIVEGMSCLWMGVMARSSRPRYVMKASRVSRPLVKSRSLSISPARLQLPNTQPAHQHTLAPVSTPSQPQTRLLCKLKCEDIRENQ